jgi:sugar O-acyltransferase (sialic acid O-acetyltransferase NeuD family)
MSDQPDPRQLVIVGDSLFAEIAHEYFQHDSPYQVVAFSVERDYRKRNRFRGLPVIAFEELGEALQPSECSVFVAITYLQLNRLRTRLMEAARRKGFPLASYVSSHAFVWRNVELGEHCFIFEDNTVQPFVRIGRNCVLWSGNHIGHHSSIGDNVFVSSHVVISGSVRIGDNSFLGVNSTLVNDIIVGEDVWLGPDVVITRDVEPNTVWRPPRSERRETRARELFGVEA